MKQTRKMLTLFIGLFVSVLMTTLFVSCGESESAKQIRKDSITVTSKDTVKPTPWTSVTSYLSFVRTTRDNRADADLVCSLPDNILETVVNTVSKKQKMWTTHDIAEEYRAHEEIYENVPEQKEDTTCVEQLVTDTIINGKQYRKVLIPSKYYE